MQYNNIIDVFVCVNTKNGTVSAQMLNENKYGICQSSIYYTFSLNLQFNRKK